MFEVFEAAVSVCQSKVNTNYYKLFPGAGCVPTFFFQGLQWRWGRSLFDLMQVPI